MEILRILRKLLKSKNREALTWKVTSGGFWVFLSNALSQVTGIVKMIVLARLLIPSDFGLIGIAGFILSILDLISKPGFRAALIQKEGDIKDYINSIWGITILRGAGLCLIVFFSAPFVAQFFKAPNAVSIIRAMSFTFLLNSLTNPGVVYFVKNLDFRRQFIFDISGTLVDVAVAIPLALLLRNVWALVITSLADYVANVFISYVICSYRPSLFGYNAEKAKELFRYGKWISGINLIGLLINQGDNAFVGRFLGVNALGFYSQAFKFSNIPATQVTGIVSQVAFPAYSQLQGDIKRLREWYLKTLQVISFISIPLAGGMFALASEFTHIFLGDKWMPMVPAFQVLSLYGLVRSIAGTTGTLFQAVGKPDILAKLVFVRLVMMALLIYPLSLYWGIVGTSLAVFLSALFIDPFSYYMVIRIIECSIWDFFKIILLPLINTVIMVLLIFGLKNYNLTQIRIINFLLIAVLGALLYFGMTYFIEGTLNHRIKDKVTTL